MEKIKVLTEFDNVAVALNDLQKGEFFQYKNFEICVNSDIPAKHKISLENLNDGSIIKMYGVPVGVAVGKINIGELLTTKNVKHISADYDIKSKSFSNFSKINIKNFNNKKFLGYPRLDGQAGTANYWIVVPLVFCQNRNIKVLQEAFETELGFKKPNKYKFQLRKLLKGHQNSTTHQPENLNPIFKNIDGIKFLTHQGGCGGTKKDADSLVKLIAGYIKNPNVGGASILSLGCQHAQIDLLKEELGLDYLTNKKILFFEQQQYRNEEQMLTDTIDQTFAALEDLNKMHRVPVSLNKLTIGLECGGSDGFSGISANPLIGLVSDKINALGGKSILSEFPELCGVEQDLIDRCKSRALAQKFIFLMKDYSQQAKMAGSGFDMNPSPGNIKDGLITDAIKSAGAATKGGRGMITGVLDYGEYIEESGLNLLCTPGNDVESTTALAGAGANLILFSTGLGTPTGNPISPVIKISSNSDLPKKMDDIIDFDAGKLVNGEVSHEELSEDLMKIIIKVASGKLKTKAQILEQDDFIPWKRGVSL